ncbi:response regulator transcription factor [Microbaculum marinum]|uniref:Response regulator n=1 Tax=Microbaculum marinum TaxID=1764581 RepID=A0AAW9RNW1_9HYPH
MVSVVDDDDAVRIATTKLLRLHDFSAHAFSSAEELLESPRALDSDCLVTDVRMPGMSGVELQCRLQELGRRIPVVFVTAFPDRNLEARAEQLGAICVLTKPFDADALVDCLRTALSPTADSPES